MPAFILYLGLLLTSISMSAQQSIEGVWDTGQENTKIEITNNLGKIYSSDNKMATVGKIMIKELIKTNNTYKGKLYLVRRNRWVDAVFIPKGNSLTVTISAGWQSKTLKWNFVKKS